MLKHNGAMDYTPIRILSIITHCCEIVRVIVTRREQKRTEVETTIYSPNMERIHKLNGQTRKVWKLVRNI